MALISCKECNNQISDTVVNCPHCGFIYRKQLLPWKTVMMASKCVAKLGDII